MNLRFYPVLLSFAMLMVLHACGTTGSGPVIEPVRDLPTQAETSDRELQGRIPGEPFDRSLEEVIELSKSMSGYQPELALEILRSLESVSSSQLTAMIDGQTQGPEFSEWLELSLLIRTLMISAGPVAPVAQNWANYHYGHAINRDNFPALVSSYRALFPVPSQVAVLLPNEGGLAAAGKAIRDGILSAYFEQPGESVIRFYSSGKNSESAVAAYLQAKADGASQIIGPLRMESTLALASLVKGREAGAENSREFWSGPLETGQETSQETKLGDGQGIPILLLNQPTDNTFVQGDESNIVNSLSLSQSEEAAAVANKALAQGQEHALVIVPDSAWGTRIETAFTSAFEQGGGNIPASARFGANTSDHSAMLTRLLKIDASTQRKKNLQSRIGIPLNFEPSRRDDFDFIFLVANPVQGRELKPLLRFHDAGDLPVYAIGRVFSGRAEQASDQDLNGIVFPATPWQLQAVGTTKPALKSIRGGAYGDLYALGQDAWHLLPWLPLMQKDPDLWFPGDVGALRLQTDGHLHRQPAWAQFSAGQVVPYQWSETH
ncbi:penicillin-binding protein activator [Pseudomonadota bacterium]